MLIDLSLPLFKLVLLISNSLYELAFLMYKNRVIS